MRAGDQVSLLCHMGVSENSVPLNPMVLLIIIPIKWLFHWEYTQFSDKPICCFLKSHYPGSYGHSIIYFKCDCGYHFSYCYYSYFYYYILLCYYAADYANSMIVIILSSLHSFDH